MAESKTSSRTSKPSSPKKTKKVSKGNLGSTSLEPEPDVSSSESDASVEAEGIEETLQIGKGVAVNREEYLQAHRDLTFDRSQLQIKNNLLHRRLADYYRKRKMIHVLKPVEITPEMEEKYQHKLFAYQELKEKSEREANDITTKVQAVETQYKIREQVAVEKFEVLQTLEKSTGTGLIYSSKGKPIADKTVSRFLTLQRTKQEQSSSMCLRYIRARNAVAELDAVVKRLERLGPGLYVFQFERLHIDNQNLMSKIEEREDELIKNRTKCTEHSQMLAHIREKMHHTEEVIDFAECDLGDAEIEFCKAREELGAIKTHRDRLRYALEDERLKAGLLTRKDLLRDYQEATDEVVVLREQKKNLEERIAANLKKLRGARHRTRPEKVAKELSFSDFI